MTVYFWIFELLCTTVGETAADYLNDNLGMGLTNTTYIMGVLLIGALFFQFRAEKYVPGVYWLAVVLISVVGILITDNLTDNMNVALEMTPRSCSRWRCWPSPSASGRPARRRCRTTASSPSAVRPSTGWRSCSPSR